MSSPLKDQPIEPTDRNVQLALTELKKLGWIAGFWASYTQVYFINVIPGREPTKLTSPLQVAIWIDGFVSGKGGLE